jgi:hypothetical protein
VSTHAAYTVKLLAVACVAAVAGKLALFNSVGCDAFDHDRADYMAYCNTPRHGHYDHAAFAYDLEPGVRAALDSANVLVLGSSHIQVALSSVALVAFERDHPSVRPYLMGFGYVEQDKFAARVIRELKPAPKVVIVNADPFFADTESFEARRLAESPGTERANAVAKRAWHAVSGAECGAGAAGFMSRIVCGRASTLYRSRLDGRWIFGGARPFQDSLPSPVALANDTSLATAYSVNAERFLAALHVDRRCVVVTLVPDGYSSESLARLIASRIGATFIAPHVDRLGSSDGSHLDTPSGERWSAAFLADLDPVLRACL